MAAPLPPLPALADHEIHLFHQIDRPLTKWDELATTLGDLASPPAAGEDAGRWVPGEIRATLGTRYADKPTWKTMTIDAGAEFHSHLRLLVSGKVPKLAVFFAATKLTRWLLGNADFYPEDTPREARTTRRMVWSPSPSARRRIAAGGIAEADILYGIEFTDLTVHAFRTGKAFVHAAIQVRPIVPGAATPAPRKLAPVEMLEAVVALARIGKLGWLGPGGAVTWPTDLRLGTILRSLIGGAAAEDKSVDRMFAYAYARFAGPVPPADADRFAFYLARHYTSDYAVRDDAGAVGRVRDFDTVGHVMTLEGAATVVGPDSGTGELPPFLKKYTSVTLHQHYVPIAVLAQHEHAFLVDKTKESNFWPTLDEHRSATLGAAPAIAKLRGLLQESVWFRLGFRFSQVSRISTHNAVNRAFRAALSLDRMLAELSADVAEATAFLEDTQREEAAAQRERAEEQLRQAAAQRERTEQRFLYLARFGAAGVAGLGVFNVANEFLTDRLNSQSWAGWWSLLVSLAALVAVYVLLLERERALARQARDTR